MCKSVFLQFPGNPEFRHRKQQPFKIKIMSNSKFNFNLAETFVLFFLCPQQARHFLVPLKQETVFNSQLLESPTAEVLIAKLLQKICVHMRQQGGHFQRKPQFDEPGVTEVPHTQTLKHTKYIEET